MDFSPLKELIEIDSPTGFTRKAAEYVFQYLKKLGYKPAYTNKGAVVCALGPKPVLGIAGHIDTLGAIVSGIRADGHLNFSVLNGLSLNMAEGEYCRIYTHSGKQFTGTLLLDNPSVHVNAKVRSTERSQDAMFIRLDEVSKSKKETEKLGIGSGDFIAFDVRYQHTKAGYIKSRFLDNKAGCFAMMELARQLKGREYPVELFFSNYEEVGHGGAGGYADSIRELLVVDMGVVGNGCEGEEESCSICAKDSSGPYDYDFRHKLVELARKHKIAHKVDVYPFYSSDGSAALRAGGQYRVALIGMGVAASHGVERTHEKGIKATVELMEKYIKQLK